AKSPRSAKGAALFALRAFAASRLCVRLFIIAGPRQGRKKSRARLVAPRCLGAAFPSLTPRKTSGRASGFWYNPRIEETNVPSGNCSPANANGLRPLFTVGHSILEFENFAALLKDHAVQLLADVRSLPQSTRLPHFSQPAFEKLLGAEHISYLFLGEELGGRPDDVDAYRPDGLVDYQVRRKSYAFQRGLERLLKELEGRSVAMTCAEEDPLECHRFLMVCPELVKLGVHPLHIRKDSKTETQEAAENRLLAANGFAGVAANTLFPQARSDALEDAYRLQAE